jgi:hypothetical protein
VIRRMAAPAMKRRMCGRGTLFILVPKAEAIRGYEQYHRLGGSLESDRMAVDAAVTMVRDKRSRTKVVVAVSATVRTSRRPGGE